MMVKALLGCRGITKLYEGFPVVEKIDLDLERGNIISLVGPSGVGKTTLFNVLSGLDRPDEGRVLFSGGDITGISGKVSYMMQKDLLLEYRTVLDNVILPLLIKRQFGKPGLSGKAKRRAREYAASFFERFGLAGYEKKYPRQLSGGMRQRAALLRTCLQNYGSGGSAENSDPENSGGSVILMDEPFSSLDALTRRSMQEWFLDIAGSMELSALVITHDVEEAIVLSDRIYVMNSSRDGKGPGKICAVFTIGEPRPRARDFSAGAEFTLLKRQILAAIDNRLV